jgi:hypothetical protein
MDTWDEILPGIKKSEDRGPETGSMPRMCKR